MNTSKLEPIWSYELDDYFEERYGIDIHKVICEAILEAEDVEKSSNNGTNSSKNTKT